MLPRYSDHAANERTFLAWVRTVIAIEGFGIVAARIGSQTAPVWTEAALLAAGGVVILLSFVRMQLIRKRIDSPEPADNEKTPADAVLFALVVALFGLVAAFGLHVR